MIKTNAKTDSWQDGETTNMTMQTNLLKLAALALMPAAMLTLTSCSSPSTPPPEGTSMITFTKGVPGGTIVQTFKMSATVTALDHTKRQATLLDSGEASQACRGQH